MSLKSVLDGIDLISARLRGPLKTVFGLGLLFQAALVSGTIKVPPGTKWANIVTICSLVLAYFTQRNGEPQALKVAKVEEAIEAVHGAEQAVKEAKDAVKP